MDEFVEFQEDDVVVYNDGNSERVATVVGISDDGDRLTIVGSNWTTTADYSQVELWKPRSRS